MALLEKIVGHTEWWIMYEDKRRPEIHGLRVKLHSEDVARSHFARLVDGDSPLSYELYEVRVERTVVRQVEDI